MRIRQVITSALVGYVFGTFPSADLASRLAGGPDLREAGSENPGATNAANVLGPAFGLGVLALDIAKGAGASLFGRHAGRACGASALAQVAATSAVIGHCYPVWSGGRGGKGVATGVGQVLATFPAFFPIDVAVAIATASSPQLKQRAFAATAASSTAWILLSIVWWRRKLPNFWGPDPTGSLVAGAVSSTAVILHRFWRAR